MIPQTAGLGGERPQALTLVSPSLSAAPDTEAPAYELKFLLTEAQAVEVEGRVQGRLIPDPHAEPGAGNAYQTTSLYCDTAEFDVFHRRGPCKRRKHRVRRYGRSPWVFLERKKKRGDRVEKRRTEVPEAELALLASPLSVTTWAGHWFHRHLEKHRLRPVCRIAYERVALVGLADEGSLRLTLDREVRGVFTDEWGVAPVDAGLPLLTGYVLCEFKYRAFLPSLFKEVIQTLRLTPSPVSKYRTFLRVSGRLDGGRDGHA